MGNVEKLFTDKNITSVGFDLDNTLLDTDSYYVKVKDSVFSDFIDTNFNGSEKEEKIKKLNDVASSRYKHRHQHGLKPPLIHDECFSTISDSFPDLLDEKLDGILELHTKDFYMKSPALYPEAIDFLNLLTEVDSINHIFGATDAQEDWSRIKAEYILSSTRLKEFPYFSTDLKVRKNPEWWLDVFSNIETNPENIMIVGDNYYADIYSSLLAGVKHAIWINRHGKSLEDFEEYPLPKGAEVITVKNIREIS